MLLTALNGFAESSAASYAGRSVARVIDEFIAAGHPFVYSSNVVTAGLRVRNEPQGASAVEIVREILAPHGLLLRREADLWLIVPGRQTDDRGGDFPPTGSSRPVATIDTVVVAASRYEISRDPSASRFSFDRRDVQSMPDIGEDPLRVAQRLPGAAASGASAVAHFRGGAADEVGILLNGQRLFEPFHVRDYQTIFSAIDARAIEDVEVYTGGFPVRFGDRMSGVVIMNSLDVDSARQHEVGISTFNTSLLTAGREGSRNWLLSARRGNLDLIVDPKYGRPAYFDVFGEFGIDLGSSARLTANALYADDGVQVIIETDPEEREQVSSDTRNAQFWLELGSAWSPTLESHTVLSVVNYANRRRGEVNDPEKLVAAVVDDRDVRRIGFYQDWVWSPDEAHRTQWGLHAEFHEADYRYAGVARYGGLQARFERDAPDRLLTAAPRGSSYALYVADRWRLSDRLVLEWGLRWDDQTYTSEASDSQLSPRASLLLGLGARTELRVSAGRYQQAQSIQSLQIEDGITEFWPAQRSDAWVAGLRHVTERGLALRVEAFVRDIGSPRPRFENLFDPLGVVPELQADRVRLSPTSAEARGVELSADLTRGDWHWWATYTWSKATDEIAGRNVPRSWDQRHALQGGFGWKTARWTFDAAASVHSGWPTTMLELAPDGRAVPGPRNAEDLPLFASVDFRLSRRFRLPKGSLLAFLEVSNTLNRRNVCCIDWDLEEDEAGTALLESSRDYWMPLLPAVGLLWEFD